MKINVSEGNASIRKCAFCKNWFDPACSAIQPRNGRGTWQYESDIKCKCRERNVITMASGSCSKFQIKL